MFLQRWRSGQAALWMLVAALLVLGGVNVAGLMKGEQAINEAKAKPCRLAIFGIEFEAGGRSSGDDGCGDGRFNCIHIGWAPSGEGTTRAVADL